MKVWTLAIVESGLITTTVHPTEASALEVLDATLREIFNAEGLEAPSVATATAWENALTQADPDCEFQLLEHDISGFAA